MPATADGYAVRASGPVTAHLLADGSGYLVAVDAAASDTPAVINVYLLEPE